MGYVTYDSNGNIVSQSASPTTPVSGGGSTGTTSGSTFVLNMGHFWSTAAQANTYYQTMLAVVNIATNGNGLTPYSWGATGSGTVTGVYFADAGPAGGTHTVQIYVNGTSQQTVTMGTGATGFSAQQPASVSFNANDVITAWGATTASGNTQFQIALTIKLN